MPLANQISKIEYKEKLGIIEAIQKLVEKPRLSGCKKLSGRPGWRIRVGSYRVIYEVQDELLLPIPRQAQYV